MMPTNTPTAIAQPEVLRFDNVTVDFLGHKALDRVSFRVTAGETRVLFGAAGAGKTVLLKTAMGLQRATSGKVVLFGQDITRAKEQDLFDIRAKVGILFQESALFDSLTIFDNVAYPLLNQKAGERPKPEEVDRRVREALCFVELQQTVNKVPSELSGGMRRRVGIARANVTNPPLMLYDSPTAGLDPITANLIMALIVKNRDLRQTTTLLVSHRLQDGEILANYRYDAETGRLVAAHGTGGAARTVYMVFHEGQLVFEGSEEELKRSRDAYVARFVRKTA